MTQLGLALDKMRSQLPLCEACCVPISTFHSKQPILDVILVQAAAASPANVLTHQCKRLTITRWH